MKIVEFWTSLQTFLIAEQLEKIESGMDSINADMQIAEKALKGMELCCGIFPKFWKKWVIPYHYIRLDIFLSHKSPIYFQLFSHIRLGNNFFTSQQLWLFHVKEIFSIFRSNEFKEDDAIWKGGEDGGVGGGGPPPSGMGATGPTGGYVAK